MKAVTIAIAVAATAATCWLLWGTNAALGVPGEWVWNRVAQTPSATAYAVPALTSLSYVTLTMVGWNWFRRGPSRRAWPALLALALFAAAMQYSWTNLPDPGIGLERAPVSLVSRASSGYFAQAKTHDWNVFLKDYREWIAKQDSFHIGTHPPGLFWKYRGLIDFFEANPKSADWIVRNAPRRFLDGFQVAEIEGRLQKHEAAAVCAAALVTWLASLATLFPIYGLLRSGRPQAEAWFAAGAWPLIPAPVLFFPVSDCLFPVLAVTIVWLGIRGAAKRSVWSPAVAGIVLFFSLTLSLAFAALLPILIAGAYLTSLAADGGRPVPDNQPLKERLRFALRQGSVTWISGLVGFGLCVAIAFFAFGMNLPAVWSINLSKHSGFYEAMPRSYWIWVGVNLVEFAVVCGPAAITAALVGLASGPRPSGADGGSRWLRLTPPHVVSYCWLATLLLLNFSGKNLSEVARLWIFLTPFACAAFALGCERLDCGFRSRAILLLCQAAVAMALIANVEPLLPIAIPQG